MNFYASSNMPVYHVEREPSRPKSSKPVKQGSKKSRFLGLQTPLAPRDSTPVRPVTSSDGIPHDAHSIDRLLDPAVEGPPSPESLRELSQQMKRASALDKHHSHQTSSSGSSSLRSLTSADRPSWENPHDGRELSRKSSGRSGRSTTSSMPSRDRPESVQIFGKTIFSRRGKAKRESSAQSSSSSMYSTDAVVDTSLLPAQTSAPSRDSTIPALFNLRRNTKQDLAAEAHPRVNISGPYNFQHVAHQKDQGAQRANRATLASEYAQLRASQTPAHVALKGVRADDMHFSDFSSDSLPLNEDDAMLATLELQKTPSLTRTPSVLKKNTSSRRILNRSQSQEQLNMGIPPPRPPRSPIDQSAPSGPIPPPRGSSQASSRHERFDSVDRPRTGASMRSLQMYADPGSPPATSYGYTPASDMGVIPEHAYAYAASPQDDSNWPLPCPSSTASEYTLPNVPEEDESAVAVKKSRASVASNSSLRGSQSVPMLRGFASQKTRPPSDASDTLGRFDLLSAQRALRAALSDGESVLPREGWEDDIDYCYDHEAEADCDYEWGRPSLETSRDGDSATPVDDHRRSVGSCEASPTMLTPGQFDVPALSPVSQLSSATAQEAITPVVVNNPKASNFSLPRVDSKSLLLVRKPSNASSFKESHGFNLSPSLLIPMDFQQQMMACEVERQEASDFAFRPLDEPALNMDSSAHLGRYRTSASTTGTIESTSSAFDKHASTASTSTDYTRLTASVSSLDLEPCLPAGELQRFPSFESQGRGESKSAMPTLPESGEAVSATRGPLFQSRGSESSLGGLAADEPLPGKAKASIQARRGRSRTTSLSTPPPPNQYALFPSVQLSGNRI